MSKSILYFAIIIFIKNAASQKLTEAKARQLLTDASIPVNKPYPSTRLDGIRKTTIDGIISLKRTSRCGIVVSGGTETGRIHKNGIYSHANGYKVDIHLNACIDDYIKNTFKYIGLRRDDGAPQYKSKSGDLYALERKKNHWDITYY